MSFLGLKDKTLLITGVANRRSVAWHVAKTLQDEGAQVVFSVHSEERRESLKKLIGDARCFICDVEKKGETEKLGASVAEAGLRLDGFLHSIAFANYERGLIPFHESDRDDFAQAMQISTFSLVEMAKALKPHLQTQASVVTVGISSLTVTPENYGLMSPVKAALASSVRFLAKSFSRDSEVRFNTLGAGPLRTNSSAGIPGYMDNYLYAEKLTFRKRALTTQEVANAAVFLLSPASSGVNGTEFCIDAGLGLNSFDAEVVERSTRP